MATRIMRRFIIVGITGLSLGAGITVMGQTTPRSTAPASTPRLPAPVRPAPAPSRPATPAPARPAAAAAPRPTAPARTATPAPVTAKPNPFLPAAINVESFFADLTLSPKTAPTAPAKWEPLLAARDWQTYRKDFGTQADGLTGLRASGQFAFARQLIDAATFMPSGPELAAYPPDLRRYLFIRAAAIAYRSTGGFEVADKAVTAYLPLMDKTNPAQVGALWSIANIMARSSTTPKPDRIRYDAIAARANMQLALLMLDADQIEAAQAITKQVAYHEGWLKTDPATRTLIAQVRAEVRQSVSMLDFLATQYQPAQHNDLPALTAVYLYGRYVKGNLALVSNLPGRVPESPLAQLVAALDAVQRGDIQAAFKAAETLRLMAAALPDAHIRARTLYAAMQLYDAYLASPLTERDRLQRTLARIAREGVVSDGARRAGSIDPFAMPPAATAPAISPATSGTAAP